MSDINWYLLCTFSQISHRFETTFKVPNFEPHKRQVSLPSPMALLCMLSNFSTSLLKRKYPTVPNTGSKHRVTSTILGEVKRTNNSNQYFSIKWMLIIIISSRLSLQYSSHTFHMAACQSSMHAMQVHNHFSLSLRKYPAVSNPPMYPFRSLSAR